MPLTTALGLHEIIGNIIWRRTGDVVDKLYKTHYPIQLLHPNLTHNTYSNPTTSEGECRSRATHVWSGHFRVCRGCDRSLVEKNRIGSLACGGLFAYTGRMRRQQLPNTSLKRSPSEYFLQPLQYVCEGSKM